MMKIVSTNPSLNFELIGDLEIDTEESIKEKVKQARIAQEKWGSEKLETRIILLREIYEKIKEKKEILAQIVSLEMGMAIRESRDEVQWGLNYFLWYLDNAQKYLNPEITFENESEIHRVYYEAKGVVVAISPWNYPSFMFVWTCIQALLAWNSVIFKTSKEVILTWKIIADIVKNSSLPAWVWEEVYGDGKIGDILTRQDVDFITFTGSTNVGKNIAKIAWEKWIGCVMELWWSAPWIICEDAKIDEVLATIYYMRFSNCGQMCDGLKRLIVHETKYEELKTKLSNLLSQKKVWIAQHEDTDIGPLVSESQLKNLQEQYNDAINLWAKIVFQSQLSPNLKWAYFAPTLLENISFDMKVWKEEVFWPILPIVSFKEIDEAIQLANDTPYWLWAYVFTENKSSFEKIAKNIKTGMVQMNNVNYCIPQDPFWWYKNSWIGREHGKWGFYEFTNVKVTSSPK